MALDAVAAGCGIWATHFIAMLAYDPASVAGYNIGMTSCRCSLRSFTGVGLRIALHDGRQARRIGGAVVGLGMAAMHYTGMMALEVPARIAGRPISSIASILSACAFGALALVVATRAKAFARRHVRRCCSRSPSSRIISPRWAPWR